MGCDIHCYIEYRKPDSKFWNDFGGRINPGRHYAQFARMAGVRNYWEIDVKYPPRGYPADASFAARDDNHLYITQTEGDGYVTPEQAEKWIAGGYSKYMKDCDGDENRSFVTNPDYHSHSWLSTEEFACTLSDLSDPEYLAILAAMRSFENQGFVTRLVFWFDN